MPENKNLNPQLSETAVMCSSCFSIIQPEDKKHCFWEENEEQDQTIPKMCFDCFMENQAIEKDFGF